MEAYAVYMYIIWYTCQSHNSMPPQKKTAALAENFLPTRKLRWPPHSAASDGRSAVPTRVGPCKSDGKPNRQWPHQLRPLRALVDLTLQTPKHESQTKKKASNVVCDYSRFHRILNSESSQQWLNWKDAVGFSVSIYISECFSFLWTTCHWHKVYHKVHLWIHCIVLKHFPWGGAKWEVWSCHWKSDP